MIVLQPLFIFSHCSETAFEPSKFTPFDGIGSRLGQLGIFERLRTRGRQHGGSFVLKPPLVAGQYDGGSEVNQDMGMTG